MKKIPPKKLNRISKWKQQVEELEKKHSDTVRELEKAYDIDDDHYDKDLRDYTDNDHEFSFEVALKYADFDKQRQIINAKWAACFLIATNIARRGKLLHPEVAKKKLQKHGRDGQIISNMLDQVYCPQVINAVPYLARELYRSYHIIVMAEYVYDYHQKMINHYSGLIYGEAKAQHYKNFARKFHEANIRQSRLLRQKLAERPF